MNSELPADYAAWDCSKISCIQDIKRIIERAEIEARQAARKSCREIAALLHPRFQILSGYADAGEYSLTGSGFETHNTRTGERRREHPMQASRLVNGEWASMYPDWLPSELTTRDLLLIARLFSLLDWLSYEGVYMSFEFEPPATK